MKHLILLAVLLLPSCKTDFYPDQFHLNIYGGTSQQNGNVGIRPMEGDIDQYGVMGGFSWDLTKSGAEKMADMMLTEYLHRKDEELKKEGK